MEVLRSVVVLLHIVGFAITFGAWVAEAAAGRFRTTRVMDYGLLASLLTGRALARSDECVPCVRFRLCAARMALAGPAD